MSLISTEGGGEYAKSESRRALIFKEIKNPNNRNRLLSEKLGLVAFKIPDELWERHFPQFQVINQSCKHILTIENKNFDYLLQYFRIFNVVALKWAIFNKLTCFWRINHHPTPVQRSKYPKNQETILPNFVFRFPIFAANLECVLQMEKNALAMKRPSLIENFFILVKR